MADTKTTDTKPAPTWGSLFELSVLIRSAERKSPEKPDAAKEAETHG